MQSDTGRNAFQQLRFRQLEMVRLLADTGSLRTTAGLMNVTAPALSKSLREVETLIGHELFIRSSRGVAPTPLGSEVARQARLLLHGLDALRHIKPETLGSERALLRLGTAPFVAWRIMPSVIERLRAADARLRIHLVEGRIIPLADQLLNGDLDAILTVMTPEALQVLGRAEFLLDQIHSERVIIVCSPRHPWAGRRVSWPDLATADWIMPPQTFTLRLTVQRACLQAGAIPPEPVIESVNIPAVINYVKAGLGITAALRSTAKDDLNSGALRLIRTDAELPTVPIGLAARRTPTIGQAMGALRDAFERYAATASET
ncbi:LysR family transcriptional regulator [Bosea sp. 117]|uniref:LysR family transcriptional regulator n=1 Tax=Bosea sp. 117 TaxID=1125973 RepID=UPI0004944533|nr:LysR family transcriptional regulator [Bosea sp. 117]